MEVRVQFYSYFKDLTGCAETRQSLPAGSRIENLLSRLFQQFPRLAAMQRSMLIAVGVEYQPCDYVLNDGDEISLFPPVQGG